MNRRDFAQLLTMAGFLVSVVAAASYIFHIPALREWSDPPMALNTAACFVVYGLAIFILATEKRDGGGK